MLRAGGLPRANPPDVSVIIVTWNVRDLALDCLQALEQRSGSLDVEAIVVDNASSDGTVTAVRSAFPGVTLIANGGNVGFPAANNHGLAQANGRHVLFLNPDTAVGEGTLERCVRELDRDSTVGMVGCQMTLPDGSVQYEGVRRAYRLRHIIWEAFYLHELFPRNALFAHQLIGDWDHRGSRDVEAILGAFMMVRRELAQAIGGLPDEVFMFHEDLGFCLRVQAAGYRIRYVGDVETLHHVGASRGKAISRLNLLEGEVRVRLIQERGGPLRAACARPAFAFRSFARLTGALVGGALPGMAALRAKRPKAFDVRVHALHLLWALAPAAAARFLPRADESDAAVVLRPRTRAPLGKGKPA